jgi:hypothetical protein
MNLSEIMDLARHLGMNVQFHADSSEEPFVCYWRGRKWTRSSSYEFLHLLSVLIRHASNHLTQQHAPAV